MRFKIKLLFRDNSIIFSIVKPITLLFLRITKVLLLVLGVSAMSINSMAQEINASKNVKELLDSARVNRKDSIQAFKYAHLAITEAKKTNSVIDLALAYANAASISKRYNQLKEAIKYYDRAIEKYESVMLPLESAELLRKSGRVYYNLGDYEEAMKRYLKGLKSYEKYNVTNDSKAWTLRYIGSVFKRQKSYNKALDYYQKSYDVFEELEDLDGMSSSINNIGIIHGKMNNDSLQLVYFKKALELARSNGSKSRESLILDNIGSVYSDDGLYKLAMSHFKKSYEYLRSENNPDYAALSGNRQYIADLYLRRGMLDSAEFYLKEAESLISNTEKKKQIELVDIYGLFSDLYFQKEDFKKAYEYQSMYYDIDDLIHNNEINSEIERLELAHTRNQLKEKTKSKNKIGDVKNAYENAWVIFLSIGSLILVLFTIIVLFQKSRLSNAYEGLSKSMEKEKQLGALKSLFVATASHQFRTPLTIIKSNMSLLQLRKYEIPEQSRESFEQVTNRVSNQVDHMTILMDQVMMLSKINSGMVKTEYKETDLVEVCKAISSDVEEILEDGRKTKFIINGDQNTLKLDKTLLEHAFSNLLSNAFKYSKGEREPITTINFHNTGVEISIRDHGIGIPEQDLEHLFEPFYRASNATEIRGSGLGTAVAKEFIEMMNGTVTVTSEKGVGSEFVISFKESA